MSRSFCTLSRAVSVLWHVRYADCSNGYKPCFAICACVCSKTARSVSLETYCKLLTGRKFVKSANKPGDFRSGVTNASFQSFGKCPDVSEELIMRVITGRSMSRHETTGDVGAGSNGQDFLADVRIKSRTLHSLRGWKVRSSLSGPTSGSSGTTIPTRELATASKFERMVLILRVKNRPISLLRAVLR